jgi:hypothetical protein
LSVDETTPLLHALIELNGAMPIPMLADFAVRLACGLAILLLATRWRDVPPRFFRTHCLVILGLLALAALDLWRQGGGRSGALLVIASAVLAYFATVAWGLGLPRIALPVTFLIVLGTAAVLIGASRTSSPEAWALGAAGRLASAFLLGSTMTAMLLGHYYLTSPAMSIDPLRRFVLCIAWALGLRGLVSVVDMGLGGLDGQLTGTVDTLMLASRWGVGFVGVVVATFLAWRTVQIRSTQSATGILYIAMILVLFGELTALIRARDAGLIF